MRKIGLLVMALVLALGTLGVGFAMWSETIDISGTVTTGDVDIDQVSLTGTWVYKITECNHDLKIHEGATVIIDGVGWHDAQPVPPAGSGETYEGDTALLVAHSDFTTNPAVEDQTVVGHFDNLFPLETGTRAYRLDYLFHYCGSVPVRIDKDFTGPVDSLLSGKTSVKYYASTSAGAQTTDITSIIEGYQLEASDWILVVIEVMIPDDNDYQSLPATPGQGAFSLTLNLEQWNEYAP